jgi:DNA-directed RNA polymerase subunit L
MEKINNINVKKVLEEKEDMNTRLELNIQGVNHTVINTLRRVAMSEIPIYVFDNISIKENTTIFNNNYIKLRMRNIPVYGINYDSPFYIQEDVNDNNEETSNLILMDDINLETDTTNVNSNTLKQLTMYIDIKNDTNMIKVVGTDDCKFYLKENEIKSPYKTNIPILKLQEKQHIKMTAITELGIEKLHGACYSPVQVFYFNKLKDTEYLLCIESRGQLTEYKILEYTIKNVFKQLELFKEKVSELEDVDKLQGVIEIDNFDHTIGNLISDGLRLHKDVSFGGYSMPHLLDEKIKISFKLNKNKIKNVLMDVIKYYTELFEKLNKQLF